MTTPRSSLPGSAWLLFALSALPLPGCFWFTSAASGEQLRADVDQLRLDLDAQQASLEEERVRFAEMRQEAEAQVEQLRTLLQETTDLLARNSADFGAEFQELADEVRRLRGKVDEALVAFRSMEAASATQTRRLDRLERYAGLDPEIDPDEAPATADELWAKAKELVEQANYGTARAYFRLFAARYPGDARTSSTEVEIGVAYALDERYDDAIATLGNVAQARPDSPDMDRVYYYTASSLFGLARCSEARTLLRTMVRKYPESPLKADADALLAAIQTDARCR
ncbi:MAG: outer membrane protein assembly factor BamD [Deltaproteobacteria bacterium]|nr:outer membrane protein assembly factor BamD [Deltaproteobacteria bacterium]